MVRPKRNVKAPDMYGFGRKGTAAAAAPAPAPPKAAKKAPAPKAAAAPKKAAKKKKAKGKLVCRRGKGGGTFCNKTADGHKNKGYDMKKGPRK